MMTINNRIKDLRKLNLGLTMEEFGNKLGVGKTAISKIESGDRGVTEQMIVSICREFGVNPEWLRNGEGEMFVAEDTGLLGQLRKEYRLTDLETAIMTEFLQMNPKERQLMLEYGRDLIRKAEDRLKEDDRPLGTPEGIAEAEAAYEKALGIAPMPGSTVSSTTGEEQLG